MRVEVRRVGSGALIEAREMAAEAGCNLRAPHHSVSQAGLIGELAIAAGGVLFLDEVEEFRGSALRTMVNHLGMMQEKVRPVLFVTHCGDELPEAVAKTLGLKEGR